MDSDITTVDIEHCKRWPYGLCTDEHCQLQHHPNLDPALPESSRKIGSFMVSNDVGEACARCSQSGRECDKKGRFNNKKDPCSECRWFGGKDCDCILAHHSSYNDQLWRIMLLRADQGFTLPQPLARDAAKRNKAPPTKIPDDQIRFDWSGQSREELLAKSDDNAIVPAYVRQLPRAYLVPPRISGRETKSLIAASIRQREKRKRDEEDDTQTPSYGPAVTNSLSLPASRAVSTYPSPVPHQLYGAAISAKYNEERRRWEYTYADQFD